MGDYYEDQPGWRLAASPIAAVSLTSSSAFLPFQIFGLGRKGDYFSIASGKGGTDMRTTILAYVIAFLRLVMIVGGVASFVYIRSGPRPIAVRNYAMAVTMICVGFAMGGIAQALRVLVGIALAIQPH
jgi:uncharacterized integral membrane protein